MPRTIWIAVAAFGVLGALTAATLATGHISADTAIVALASVALVAVTIVYVGVTSDIARANAETVAATKRLADETAMLALETTRMAKAADEQAATARESLRHARSPLLVLRVTDDPPPGLSQVIPLQVQNVGEGAAVWPSLKWVHDASQRNLWGDHPPHIFPPRQFGEEAVSVYKQESPADVIEQKQKLGIPKPDGVHFADPSGTVLLGGELRVGCTDPRSGHQVERLWRVFTTDDVKWWAEPVSDEEPTAPAPAEPP